MALGALIAVAILAVGFVFLAWRFLEAMSKWC